MGKKIYFGRWGDYEQMLREWRGWNEEYKLEAPIPAESEVLFASYGGGAYEGDAFVLFTHEGKLYEVHGSHCSCYGLEDQWKPEETSWTALAIRSKRDPEAKYNYAFLYDHDEEAVEAYWALVDNNFSYRDKKAA